MRPGSSAAANGGTAAPTPPAVASSQPAAPQPSPPVVKTAAAEPSTAQPTAVPGKPPPAKKARVIKVNRAGAKAAVLETPAEEASKLAGVRWLFCSEAKLFSQSTPLRCAEGLNTFAQQFIHKHIMAQQRQEGSEANVVGEGEAHLLSSAPGNACWTPTRPHLPGALDVWSPAVVLTTPRLRASY